MQDAERSGGGSNTACFDGIVEAEDECVSRDATGKHSLAGLIDQRVDAHADVNCIGTSQLENLVGVNQDQIATVNLGGYGR